MAEARIQTAGQAFRPVLTEAPEDLLGEAIPAAFLELSSIAHGYRAADAMIKMAPVDMIEMAPIDPGRCLILLAGEVAALEAALEAGVRRGGEAVLDSLLLPRMDAQILPALAGGATEFGAPGAMGLLESTTVISGIRMADAACKAAEVLLFELRAAQGIGGKVHSLLLGPLHMVEAAVAAGAEAVPADRLVAAEIIPNPDPAFMVRSLAGRALGGVSGAAG